MCNDLGDEYHYDASYDSTCGLSLSCGKCGFDNKDWGIIPTTSISRNNINCGAAGKFSSDNTISEKYTNVFTVEAAKKQIAAIESNANDNASSIFVAGLDSNPSNENDEDNDNGSIWNPVIVS